MPCQVPAGSIYGPNVHGANLPYAGPHTHTTAKNAYHYEVFALDTTLREDKNIFAAPHMASLAGHVLASGESTGMEVGAPAYFCVSAGAPNKARLARVLAVE